MYEYYQDCFKNLCIWLYRMSKWQDYTNRRKYLIPKLRREYGLVISPIIYGEL